MQRAPYSRDEILEALARAEAEVASYFRSLPARELVSRAGEGWSPAEHLEHLNISVSAVAKGLSVPKLVLWFKFGRAEHDSRRYEELTEAYRQKLAAGGGASGRFVPPREDLSGAEIEARREAGLARWGRVNERLRRHLRGWGDLGLERLQMPHPLLGNLTVREMLFFTLYHAGHHVEVVKRLLRDPAIRRSGD